MKKHIAIVRGKFLNKYEMQFFEPLVKDFSLTGFGSLTSYHSSFAFPVIKLPSPMDLTDFPYKMPILNRIFVDAHYLLGLEERLRGYDLVHTAETYFRYTQQCLDAKKKGYVKKVIATVLENIPFNNEGIWGRKMYKRRAREELDHIIALTQKTKESLLVEGADAKKITVMGHYIDTQRFTGGTKSTKLTKSQLRKSNNTVVILFVGRLEEYKGVFDVLSSFVLLKKDSALRNYDLKLIFVGDGSQKNELLHKERAFGIEQFVIHRTTSYDDMPSQYQNADIFIAPSKPRIVRGRTTWEEQYCTVLLEAQATGLPIITTNSGGIPENIGDAGILVEPGDVRAIATSIKTFILNTQRREEFKRSARNRAIRVHDISIGSKKLKELYQNVLTQ